jgi:uncharacterized membrane protein (UPF0136 family)
MKLTALIIMIYGLVILLSGIYGFLVNDSIISLVLGVVFGVTLLGNSYSTLHQNFTGIYITIIVSTVLTIVFGIRLTQTLRILPVGLMFITSVISLGFCVFALSYRKTNEPEM